MDIKEFVRAESPVILAGLGILGFVGAAIMVGKVAPEVKEAQEKSGDEKFREKAKTAFPYYAMPVGLMMVSAGCIIAGTKISRFRYGALLALYSITNKNLKDMKSAVVEEFGEKKAVRVEERMAKPIGPIPPEELMEGMGDMIFFDKFGGRYFYASSLEQVRRAVNDVNELAIGEDFADINEFYALLGLPPTEFGSEWGWYGEEILRVSFVPFMHEEGRPVVSMVFDVSPRQYNAF